MAKTKDFLKPKSLKPLLRLDVFIQERCVSLEDLSSFDQKVSDISWCFV